jgi:hypothetical protein
MERIWEHFFINNLNQINQEKICIWVALRISFELDRVFQAYELDRCFFCIERRLLFPENGGSRFLRHITEVHNLNVHRHKKSKFCIVQS